MYTSEMEPTFTVTNKGSIPTAESYIDVAAPIDKECTS